MTAPKHPKKKTHLGKRAFKKRTEGQRMEDRLLFSQWTIDGLSAQEMAEKLALIRPYKISRQQVSKDLEVNHEIWRTQVAANQEVARVELVVTQKVILRESMRAFHASKQGEQEDTTGEMGKGKGKPSTFKRKVKKRSYGDPRYLSAASTAAAELARLQGVYIQPAKQELPSDGIGQTPTVHFSVSLKRPDDVPVDPIFELKDQEQPAPAPSEGGVPLTSGEGT